MAVNFDERFVGLGGVLEEGEEMRGDLIGVWRTDFQRTALGVERRGKIPDQELDRSEQAPVWRGWRHDGEALVLFDGLAFVAGGGEQSGVEGEGRGGGGIDFESTFEPFEGLGPLPRGGVGRAEVIERERVVWTLRSRTGQEGDALQRVTLAD
jgi:hypothetical protein